jgi:L-alanine-DL-glutamate epimerase-like enolase superfamily enzyme
VIADHLAAGGRVMLATHMPIAIDAAASLALDAYAPRFDDFDPEFGG